MSIIAIGQQNKKCKTVWCGNSKFGARNFKFCLQFNLGS